jgi:DNA-binding MarR family transcriptional regulator
MTALAQKITETPMAPYMALLQAMSHEEKRIVVMFLIETMNEQESDIDEIRRKLNVPESPKTKWFREHAASGLKWDRLEAWSRLTEKQREEATRLNLSAEDMDERTFYIIEKHMG